MFIKVKETVEVAPYWNVNYGVDNLNFLSLAVEVVPYWNVNCTTQTYAEKSNEVEGG